MTYGLPHWHVVRWGSVRIRMTLWNVAVLIVILGVFGAVVRYTVQLERLAAVDRTLAERAHAERPFAEQDAPVIINSRNSVRSRLLDPMTVGAEGSAVGSKRALPPLDPRIISRDSLDSPVGMIREVPWDRASYVSSLTGRTIYSTVLDGGTPTRVLSMPLERKGKVDRVLQLAYPLDGVWREINGLTSTLISLVPLGMLVVGLSGAFLTGRALRPVAEIAKAAARVGASDLSERLPLLGHDEFSELSSSINAMLARLEEAFDLQRRFTADASHELRTPLSIIKANTSFALEHDWTEDRYRDFLAAIDSAAARQSRIVEELLFLARADAGKLARDVGPVCLSEVLEEALDAISRPNRPHTILESIDPALMVLGSGSELTRLFTNLLENAVRHTPTYGIVIVSAIVDAKCVYVTVADNGEGIAPEHLARLGERFYRVNVARSAETGGTGLGLAICQSIAKAHDGDIRIESILGKGTSVQIRLNVCPGQEKPKGAPPSTI